jgi:8-oxo-dGTP diphosphatase
VRPLTSAGRRQANGLVAQLKAVGVERILSSPYQRCVETVEPLARLRGLEVEKMEALAEGAGLDAFLELVDEVGASAVYCGHADLAVSLLEPLVESRLVKAADARLQKGSSWVLERRNGRFRRARYVAPP